MDGPISFEYIQFSVFLLLQSTLKLEQRLESWHNTPISTLADTLLHCLVRAILQRMMSWQSRCFWHWGNHCPSPGNISSRLTNERDTMIQTSKPSQVANFCHHHHCHHHLNHLQNLHCHHLDHCQHYHLLNHHPHLHHNDLTWQISLTFSYFKHHTTIYFS